MKEKPILFNTEMVRAILSGQKTQTRRLIRPRYKKDEGGFQVNTRIATGERQVELLNEDEESFENSRFVHPPYEVGDILYVRETWEPRHGNPKIGVPMHYGYRADSTDGIHNDMGFIAEWHPSIHMPKEAARIFLKVTAVKVQRLQDMTIDNVLHEGVSITRGFADWIPLWNSTITKGMENDYAWEANPWVWVIYFEKI